MITLMLTFFILLFSFSTIDVNKWKTVVYSLQGALGPLDGNEGVMDGMQGIDGPSSEEEDKTMNSQSVEEFLKFQEEMQELEQLQTELVDYLTDVGMEKSVAVEMDERGLVLRFQDSVLFEKSKADILSQSIGVLREIANILKNNDNPIRIEGHTDDLPINTTKFPSNWELSTTRATNVLRFLIQEGLPGNRLSAVGYGEFRPLMPNNSEESRKSNRRVDLVLIRKDLIVNEPK
jgi:chemotaxis protein MotB